jgi:BirA family biotin operon repressor/biotin-[acetyl-CoA-carboxylase] ligase
MMQADGTAQGSVGDLIAAAFDAGLRERYPCVVALDETGSTNDMAFEMGRLGMPDGTVVVANRQTSGRGRMDRAWASAPGGLYLSILRRMREGEERASAVGLLAGMALRDAVEAASGVSARLKWPNDLLVGSRKLAGILVEGSGGWQVVGMGLNLNQRSSDLPADLRPAAVTLFDLAGRSFDLPAVAAEVLARFAAFEALFLESGKVPTALYEQHLWGLGNPVRVLLGDRTLDGVVRGVDADGALLLEGPQGVQRVLSGEVVHVRAEGT